MAYRTNRANGNRADVVAPFKIPKIYTIMLQRYTDYKFCVYGKGLIPFGSFGPLSLMLVFLNYVILILKKF